MPLDDVQAALEECVTYQRILGELEVCDLIKRANPGRDRLMLQVAYFGGLCVPEFVSLTPTHFGLSC